MAWANLMLVEGKKRIKCYILKVKILIVLLDMTENRPYPEPKKMSPLKTMYASSVTFGYLL